MDELQEALEQVTKRIAAVATGPGVVVTASWTLLPLSALLLQVLRSQLPREWPELKEPVERSLDVGVLVGGAQIPGQTHARSVSS